MDEQSPKAPLTQKDSSKFPTFDFIQEHKKNKYKRVQTCSTFKRQIDKINDDDDEFKNLWTNFSAGKLACFNSLEYLE